MILSDPKHRFQGHDIIQCHITRKWYKIELFLQWQTNSKSCMIYRTAPYSTTLNDPYRRFQGHAVVWCWISQKRYEIQTKFQWSTNRDLHTSYSTVSFRMTLKLRAVSVRQLSFFSYTLGSLLECCQSVWYGKTRIVWLPDGEKVWR